MLLSQTEWAWSPPAAWIEWAGMRVAYPLAGTPHQPGVENRRRRPPSRL